MTKKGLLVLSVVVVLTLMLSSCRLPASTGPAATPTLGEEFPFPIVTTQPDVMKEIQTQTAVALALTPVTGDQAGGGQPDSSDEQAGGGAPADQGGVGGSTGGDTAAQPTAQPTQAPPVVDASGIATPTRPSTYTLQKGEWPICIARRYNLDLASFFAANGLSMQSPALSVGTVLTIPSIGTWSSSYGSRTLVSHPANYSVQSGDTIYSVACKYGDVYPEIIAQVNGLSSPYTLTPGTTIQIP